MAAVAGLSAIDWWVSVGMSATDVFKVTAFLLTREKVPIGRTRPLRHTLIHTDAFSASRPFEEDSSGKGGNASSKFPYWIIITIAAGLLGLAVAVYLIYWRVTRVVAPECPSGADNMEWFDHQGRERLHQMTVDFENPFPLASLETLTELSDAMTALEADTVALVETDAMTIGDMDEKV
jgi:hypothetical protein